MNTKCLIGILESKIKVLEAENKGLRQKVKLLEMQLENWRKSNKKDEIFKCGMSR